MTPRVPAGGRVDVRTSCARDVAYATTARPSSSRPVVDADPRRVRHRVDVRTSFARSLAEDNTRRVTLDELRALPAVERAVTLECAGNGRLEMRPLPVGQPW